MISFVRGGKPARAPELVAHVTARGAHDVAVYLDGIIDGLDVPNIEEWKEVRDALYALSNDTDQIRTREERNTKPENATMTQSTEQTMIAAHKAGNGWLFTIEEEVTWG